MYFLEQIKTQFMNNVVNYDIEAGAAAEVNAGTEKEVKGPITGPEAVELAGDAHQTAHDMEIKSAKLEAGVDTLTGGEGDNVVGENGGDNLTETGTKQTEGEPSQEDIDTQHKESEAEITRLKEGTPDEQKQGAYLEAVHNNIDNLSPADATEINTALEDFKNSDDFAQLSPQEVQQKIDQIIEGIIAGKVETTDAQVEAAREALQNPNITPTARTYNNAVVRGGDYNNSVRGGSPSWQGLTEGNFQSSKYRSEPVERSASGTTLCSRTAFKNLSKMGVENPHRGSSAKTSYEMYGKSGDTGFPTSNSEQKFADVYLDASPKNARYGHRVAAFQEGGKWFVLDPYYAIPGHTGDRQAPIPAETYLNHMCGSKGRKFWGAQYPGSGSQGNQGSSATS